MKTEPDRVAGERTWTIKLCKRHGPHRQTYCEGCGNLDHDEEVEVVELSRLRAAEEERDALKEALVLASLEGGNDG